MEADPYWLRLVLEAARCPACEQLYGVASVLTIEEVDIWYAVQMCCTNCTTATAVLVSKERLKQVLEKETSAKKSIVTALAAKERVGESDFRMVPLSSDDVLDAHTLLQSYQGTVHDLFNPPK